MSEAAGGPKVVVFRSPDQDRSCEVAAAEQHASSELVWNPPDAELERVLVLVHSR